MKNRTISVDSSPILRELQESSDAHRKMMFSQVWYGLLSHILLLGAGIAACLLCEGTLRYTLLLAVLALMVLSGCGMIRELNRAHRQLVDRMIQENDSIRLNLKNARLSALVSQLNPHFLFNALQLLQEAVVTGSKETSNAILQSLSTMFRYSSGNTEAIVRLRDEIDFAKSFLSICERVYEGNLTTRIECPSALYDWLVPKFILQPILENSIKHGFDGAPYNNRIEVKAAAGEDTLDIEITDDGKGLSDRELGELQSYLQTSNPESGGYGIGMRNVHQRISLICGDSYGVSLKRGEKGGLCVTLHLLRILQ